MPKSKERGAGGLAILTYRSATTAPFLNGGSFDWKKPLANNPSFEGDKWGGSMPKGWTDKSRSKFYDSMSQSKEGPTTNCMKKIDGHVDDPGAFCASLRDRVTGSTKWRSGGKKK